MSFDSGFPSPSPFGGAPAYSAGSTSLSAVVVGEQKIRLTSYKIDYQETIDIWDVTLEGPMSMLMSKPYRRGSTGMIPEAEVEGIIISCSVVKSPVKGMGTLTARLIVQASELGVPMIEVVWRPLMRPLQTSLKLGLTLAECAMFESWVKEPHPGLKANYRYKTYPSVDDGSWDDGSPISVVNRLPAKPKKLAELWMKGVQFYQVQTPIVRMVLNYGFKQPVPSTGAGKIWTDNQINTIINTRRPAMIPAYVIPAGYSWLMTGDNTPMSGNGMFTWTRNAEWQGVLIGTGPVTGAWSSDLYDSYAG